MGLEPTTFGTTIRHSNRLSYIHRFRPQSRNFANRCANVIRFLVCASDFARKLFEPATGVSGKERRIPARTGTGGTDGIDFRRNDSRSRLLFRQKHPDDVPVDRPASPNAAGRKAPPHAADGRSPAFAGSSAVRRTAHPRSAHLSNGSGELSRRRISQKRCKRVSLRSSFSASTTAPRTSCSGRTEPVVCFCALLFPTSAAPKPAARQCSNKFDIAPAYSYL